MLCLRVLTDSNFAKQKAVQLSSTGGPTLFASAIGSDAWSRLPPSCLGLLVAFIGDSALNVFQGGAPTMFVPAPGRSTP